MKFIFPKNYNFKNKFLGFIDYTTIFINIIWDGLIFLFINLFFNNLYFKIFLFIILCFPFLLISFTGLNGENFVYVFRYILSFVLKQKLFFYKKWFYINYNNWFINFY